ncbi:hypothetical protein [Nocardia xishanensis]|uniref:Uncharacterized protein n=1 Tax=Nocardia xishanensis TaxID=238964 RepID=A0ABW7XCH2_9NOCA
MCREAAKVAVDLVDRYRLKLITCTRGVHRCGRTLQRADECFDITACHVDQPVPPAEVVSNFHEWHQFVGVVLGARSIGDVLDRSYLEELVTCVPVTDMNNG